MARAPARSSTPAARPATVDAYLAACAPEARPLLDQVRGIVRRVVPQGEERISYGMPAMFLDGVVVYYAAFRRHIGMYPPVRDEALRRRLARYAGPKGNLQFALAEPLPLELVEAVVRALLAENRARLAAKASRTHAADT